MDLSKMVLILLGLILILISPTAPQTCRLDDDDDREDCGFGGIGEEECIDSGCCYDSSVEDVPWCYDKVTLPGETCDVRLRDRGDCGFSGITEARCQLRGCCYEEVDGYPWCYFTEEDSGQPSFDTRCDVSRPRRIDCGHSDTRQECEARNCCYDDSNPGTIWCFEKGPHPEGEICEIGVTRKDCGFFGITERDCTETRGCCFDGSTSGLPQCYYSLEEDICEITSEEIVDCGYEGISELECLRIECCYDESQPEVCYKKPSQCDIRDSDKTVCGSRPGLSKEECNRIPACCYDETDPDGLFACYRRRRIGSFEVDTVEIGGMDIPLPDFDGCKIGTIVQIGKDLIGQFRDIASSTSVRDGLLNVLRNTEIFSIRTYCGMFSLAVDAITGCVEPFIRLFPGMDNSFFRTMNRLQQIKAPCRALSGQGEIVPGSCIPMAAKICPVNSIDILTAFSSFYPSVDLDTACETITGVLEGVAQCIEEATDGCSQAQRDDFRSLREVYSDLGARSDVFCGPGCYDLVEFIRDVHPTCSWNIARFYPDPSIENYCEYAQFAMRCGWMLWRECSLLPEEYFQRAMSVVENALEIGGCVIPDLDDYIRNPRFQFELSPCVEASIECAQELAFGLGVEIMSGSTGGYSVSQVSRKLGLIKSELVQGDYRSFCGTEDQRDDDKNPIRDCITKLTDECAGDLSSQSATIAYTAAEWFDEACQPGCYRIAENARNFCGDIDLSFEYNEQVILDLFLAQTTSLSISFDGCRIAQDYAECAKDLIEECDFLDARLRQARSLTFHLISAATNYRICGIALDYPIDIERIGYGLFSSNACIIKSLPWPYSLMLFLVFRYLSPFC